MIRVAMMASVFIALFSYIIAHFYFSPQKSYGRLFVYLQAFIIFQVFTILVGLFTQRAPALATKVVIIFHAIAYSLINFALADIVTLYFFNLYAILFFIEIIMLVITQFKPRKIWTFTSQKKVDLTP